MRVDVLSRVHIKQENSHVQKSHLLEYLLRTVDEFVSCVD